MHELKVVETFFQVRLQVYLRNRLGQHGMRSTSAPQFLMTYSLYILLGHRTISGLSDLNQLTCIYIIGWTYSTQSSPSLHPTTLQRSPHREYAPHVQAPKPSCRHSTARSAGNLPGKSLPSRRNREK